VQAGAQVTMTILPGATGYALYGAIVKVTGRRLLILNANSSKAPTLSRPAAAASSNYPTLSPQRQQPGHAVPPPGR
jgi:hypothetical protein